MTTRHEFLAQLHELLQPKVYLEIGVQHGWSLQLSKAEITVGIDPEPLIQASRNQKIYKMTSDEFFASPDWIADEVLIERIDLAFIDGMHLAEYAWRDFINITKHCHAGSVVVFDDVLPTTQEMASREMCPGDWTGDVWKIYFELRHETDFVLQLVDTTPTGTLVVTGFDNSSAYNFYKDPGYFGINGPVMPDVFDRRHAWSAPAVLENLKDRGFGA